MVGGIVALLFGGGAEVYAQQPSSVSRAATLVHGSVDGSSGHVLRSGRYAVVSLVGQSVAGSLPSCSGGIWHFHGKLQEAPEGVSLNEALETPMAFALEANYPNPFNPSTAIRYALPQPSAVRLSVYDVQGRLVRVLVEAEQPTGWHEATFEAGRLPSGVYFYWLEAGTFRDSQAMLLVR